ncbi:MAG: lytic murein transglycosylase B [Gammaproteobacteria bacterium]
MIIRFLLVICLCIFSHLSYADPNFVNQPDVQTFINQMVKKHKFKKTELNALFNTIKIRPRVIQSIKAPLEQKPWSTYQMLFVTEWRIREGVNFWNKYQDVLERAEKIYGVPASIIVATIGVETKYGRYTGEYPVIDALANLAFGNSGRGSFFRSELEQFLLLSREQHLNPRSITGSYAGAIGQPQFMPSSYRNYAVNFSGSGKIDLSHNEVDVIGSVANYYKKHGWNTSQPITIPASIHGGKYQLHLTKHRTISKAELMEAGIVPHHDLKYRVIQLQGHYGNEYWLGFHNFEVIKRYNPSDLYAMAVYQLSYYITALREKTNNGSWI